ncbi:MAG: hypothetical protein CM1200mP41_23710 [Gammaproteobacteria bacterium]|nr:MAG: hypothetical protein CM1200mP41_23710 [Gammaproteobacteria bacterium]
MFCGAEGRIGHDKVQELADTERMDTVRVGSIISVALSLGQGRIFNLVKKGRLLTWVLMFYPEYQSRLITFLFYVQHDINPSIRQPQSAAA